jgi:hypothetical protein
LLDDQDGRCGVAAQNSHVSNTRNVPHSPETNKLRTSPLLCSPRVGPVLSGAVSRGADVYGHSL